jgi:NhaA family Na+:H+ antiporter
MEADNLTARRGILTPLREFLALEASGGVIVLGAALLAMLAANTPLAGLYAGLLDTTVAVQIGALVINKPLLLWINDGLMAVFFFLVGLEIKREVLEGELSSPAQIVLPACGALGGMLVPVLIYVLLNHDVPGALNGWAIPVATDIAFALALLSAFGPRVPLALKMFLLTLAIFDDLAAIIIIALFYAGDLSFAALGAAALVLGLAMVMNWRGVVSISAYILVGVALWVLVLKSGVHATLAGVLLAFCIPLKGREDASPLREVEHDLHAPVAFVILPLFAFANGGLSFAGMTTADLLHPVSLGITAGLALGKPIGVLAIVGLAVTCRVASLPRGVSWGQLMGVACACGIGFTMSLFIAGLAFQHGGGDHFSGDRLGILIGSVLSALAAGLVLHLSLPSTQTVKDLSALSEP